MALDYGEPPRGGRLSCASYLWFVLAVLLQGSRGLPEERRKNMSCKCSPETVSSWRHCRKWHPNLSCLDIEKNYGCDLCGCASSCQCSTDQAHGIVYFHVDYHSPDEDQTSRDVAAYVDSLNNPEEDELNSHTDFCLEDKSHQLKKIMAPIMKNHTAIMNRNFSGPHQKKSEHCLVDRSRSEDVAHLGKIPIVECMLACLVRDDCDVVFTDESHHDMTLECLIYAPVECLIYGSGTDTPDAFGPGKAYQQCYKKAPGSKLSASTPAVLKSMLDDAIMRNAPDETIVQLTMQYWTARERERFEKSGWKKTKQLLGIQARNSNCSGGNPIICKASKDRLWFENTYKSLASQSLSWPNMSVVTGCAYGVPSRHGSCTPRCPKGFRPSMDILKCHSWVWWPPLHTCYRSPPVGLPISASFTDESLFPQYVSGEVQVVYNASCPRFFLGIEEVEIFFGSHRGMGEYQATSTVLASIQIRETMPYNEEYQASFKTGNRELVVQKFERILSSCKMLPPLNMPLSIQISNVSIPTGATHLLIFGRNTFGRSSPFVLPLVDLVVSPVVPQVNVPFKVELHNSAIGMSHLLLCQGRLHSGCRQPSAGSLDCHQPISPVTNQFLVAQSGIYTLCQCNTVSCNDAVSAVNEIRVSVPSVNVTDEWNQTFSPLIGTPFLAKVSSLETEFASGLLCFQSVDKACSESCSNSGNVIVHDSDPPNSGALSKGSVRWLRGVAWRSGDFRACWRTAGLNIAFSIDLGIIHIRGCESPCRTCYMHPRECTSCEDQRFSVVAGRCLDCSSKGSAADCSQTLVECAAGGNAPNCGSRGLAHPAWHQQSLDDGKSCVGLPKLQTPRHFDFDPLNRLVLLVADRDANAVFRVELSTGQISFACHTCCLGTSSGHPGQRGLRRPESVRIASSGMFFLIADTGNFVIRKVDALKSSSSHIVAGRMAEASPSALHLYDGREAIRVNLCDPVDTAIHRNEQAFVIVERKCQQQGRSAVVSFVDEHGRIWQTASLNDAAMTIEWLPMDWMPHVGDQVLVAETGGVRMFARYSNSTWYEVPAPTHVKALNGVTAARLMSGSTLLLMAIQAGRPGRETSLVTVDLALNSSRTTIAMGGNIDGRMCRPWSTAADLSEISTILISRQHKVFFAKDELSGGCTLSWIIDKCGKGQGRGSDESSGTKQCKPCNIGSYNDASKKLNDSCTACPPATTTWQVGASDLMNCTCAPGFQSTDGSNSNCNPCREGYFCTGRLAVEQRCKDQGKGERTFGKIMKSHLCCGDGMCLGEPLGSVGEDRAESVEQCGCCWGKRLDRASKSCSACHDSDWWDMNFDRQSKPCMTCERAAWCASGVAAPGAQIRARNGYWMNNDSSALYTCAHPSHCWWSSYPRMWCALNRNECKRPSSGLAGCSDRSKYHCMGVQVGGRAGGKCPPGRTGFACGRCQSGMFSIIPGQRCQSCGHWGKEVAVRCIVYCVLSAVLFAGIWGLRRAHIYALYASIYCLGLLLAFAEQMQSVYQLTLTELNWPSWHKNVIFEGFTLALHGLWPVVPECIGEAKLLLRQGSLLVLPLLVLISIFLWPGLIWLTKCLTCHLTERSCPASIHEVDKFTNIAMNLAGLIASVLVVPYVSSALLFFNCYHHEFASRTLSMRRMPDVLCFSQEWNSALPLGIVILGCPLAWFALQIYTLRHLPVMNTAAPRWGKLDEGLLTRQDHIFVRYQIKAHFWDSICFMRSFLVHTSLLLPTLHAKYRLFVIFAVNLLALLLLTWQKPHRESSVNWFEGALTMASLLFLITGISLATDPVGGVASAIRLKQGSADVISAVVVIVLIVVVYVFIMASRDIIFPVANAKRKAKQAARFIPLLQQVAIAASTASEDSLVTISRGLDHKNRRKVLHSLHLLEQLLSPAHCRNSTRWTRLNAWEWFSTSIDEELSNVYERCGSVQAVSQATSRGSMSTTLMSRSQRLRESLPKRFSCDSILSTFSASGAPDAERHSSHRDSMSEDVANASSSPA